MPDVKTDQINKNPQDKTASDRTPSIKAEKELFSWEAPSRVFIKKDKDFWVKIVVASSIFGFIIFIAEGVMPVLILISVLFLFYIFTTVEPEIVVYKITTKGVRIGDSLNSWQYFTRFWFAQRGRSNFLILESLQLPGRLEIIVGEKDREKIRKILEDYLPEEEVPPTTIDRASDWFFQKFSL